MEDGRRGSVAQAALSRLPVPVWLAASILRPPSFHLVPAGMAKLARRKGLKIPWGQPHPGSILGPGMMPQSTFKPEVDEALRARLTALCATGWDIFERFEAEVRDRRFHPFIASEYEVVLDALLAHRRPGLRFLEWGSASGVIAIMADLLGYESCGIEIDASLVATARDLAARFDSGARFVEGSFFPPATCTGPGKAVAASSRSAMVSPATSSSAARSTTSTSSSDTRGVGKRP